MKKTYIKPITDEVSIETQQIIAATRGLTFTDDNENGNDNIGDIDDDDDFADGDAW